MASVNQGGRPRNAWTPSRERKLVRLYTLTNLSKDEIKRILEAPGFNPSSSDIQKKLRALFPKDYSKDHKRYRPSNGSNMAIRLRRIRQCGGGRISKARKCSSKRKLLNGKLTLRILSCYETSANLSVTGHMKNFFRDYFALDQLANPCHPHKPICPESFPTRPELLMLDGSMLQPKAESSTEKINSECALDTMASSPWEPDIVKSSHISQKSLASSSVLSIRSIARRLTRPYSRNRLEHIRSVLRSSYSGSYRSSLLSMESVRSFDDSRNERITTNTQSESIDAPILDQSPLEMLGHDYHSNKGLEEEEQMVWDELVDETHVANHTVVNFSRYFKAWLGPRPCCGTIWGSFGDPGFLCQSCGFSGHFYLAAKLSEIRFFPPDFFQQKDHYGNTCLHYAAAGLKDRDIYSLDQIMWMLDGPITTKNTFGQTFLHLLYLPKNWMNGLLLFKTWWARLSELDFPLLTKDYHGRTAIHSFLQNVSDTQLGQYEPILRLSLPGILYNRFDSYDIFGRPLVIYSPNVEVFDDTLMLRTNSKYIGASPPKYLSSIEISSEKSVTQKRKTIPVKSPHLKLPIISMSDIDNLDLWVKTTIDSYSTNDIDCQGNSPLIGILKLWPAEMDEWKLFSIILRLLSNGVSLHMRDRSGNTALVTAACRGFRICVAQLLEFGANYHCRDFTGAGVLLQASKVMENAKKYQDAQLYSKVLSCVVILIDVGAKSIPSNDDEWVDRPDFRQKLSASFDSIKSRMLKAESFNSEEMEALNLHLAASTFSRYPRTQLGPRFCCRDSFQNLLDSDFVCERCGFATIFRLAGTKDARNRSPNKDFFGNTSCHYAAAALKDQDDFSYKKLTAELVDNFNAVNCFGQTVLHMVRLPSNSGMAREQLHGLLHQFSRLRFAFSKRDYHGRTSIHALVENNIQCLSAEDVKLILKISTPGLDSLDIFGRSLRQALYDNNHVQSSNLGELLAKSNGMLLEIDPISPDAGDFQLYDAWLDNIIRSGFINSVNIGGNSPLLSILKYFQPSKEKPFLKEIIYKLLQNGAEIHMRDRNGDTALSIATIRGFHPCVRLLLDSGANIHVRDFKGVGIIMKAKKAIIRAETSWDDKLLVGILESIKMLDEKGAKGGVGELDEWLLSEKVNERTKKEEEELREFVKRHGKQSVLRVLAESGFL